MKVKSLAAGLIIASSFVLAVGSVQAASCYNYKPGWHMVPKKCHIKPAENWQEYTSGVYTQPTARGLF
ncbi:hypothetical protein BN59_00727 [Legionella massiliensis]|uniref:Uncharacterized protein n=1 Tax=Legionella massiliensis TaxID=1034943 RepID=A0A078KXL3_9GAMM|nr:hypothetical protein [Legionella massiliensis]CDZ76458.1 hypothetical protein BN59_00727 [Legionella massiliensis]CEE12196.1 hypothetical protein BN1094_00727 [Legionella massiliensis]